MHTDAVRNILQTSQRVTGDSSIYLTSASADDAGATFVRLRCKHLQPMRHANLLRQALPTARVVAHTSMLDGNTELSVVLPPHAEAIRQIADCAQGGLVRWLRAASTLCAVVALLGWMVSHHAVRTAAARAASKLCFAVLPNATDTCDFEAA